MNSQALIAGARRLASPVDWIGAPARWCLPIDQAGKVSMRRTRHDGSDMWNLAIEASRSPICHGKDAQSCTTVFGERLHAVSKADNRT
jgi:hypothetical protein